MATSTAEWIEELKGISVLELSERIKALEEAFGVSATAVAAAAEPKTKLRRSTLSSRVAPGLKPRRLRASRDARRRAR